MLIIKGLEVSYNGTRVVRDLDLTVNRGEILAIIGESGAGKTTLGLSVMGLVEGRCTGQILINTTDMMAATEEERRQLRGKTVAMVFQNIENALHPTYRVSDQVAEGILVHDLKDRQAARTRALQLLKTTGLTDRLAEAYPHQLSGGQKQRALLALALANDPEVLILDEPTAALDAISKQEIIALLQGLARNKAAIVITHDIATAARVSNRLAVMYAGKIIEEGETAETLSEPRHPYTRGLIRSYPDISATKDLQGIPGRATPDVPGCPFHPRCTQRISVCEKETPPLTTFGKRLLACHRGGIVPVLTLAGISRSFDSIRAVDGVGLTLYEGETLALVGESGSGKTTLAKIIMGIHRPDNGVMELEGEKLPEARPPEFYRRVQMIFQNPAESISHRMNVLEAVREPLDIQGIGNTDERTQRVKKALAEVELPVEDYFLKKYPHHLSGGEAQRVAIARALVLNPKILIADEPTSAMDASIQAKILKLLLNLQENRGLAILLITHDLALARKISDRMAVMLAGRIVEEGSTGSIINNPGHDYTKSLVGASSH